METPTKIAHKITLQVITEVPGLCWLIVWLVD